MLVAVSLWILWCLFVQLCQFIPPLPPLFPWHTLSFSFNTDTENCCWLHACESSARGGRPGRATRMLTKPAEQECFPTREHLLTAAILQLRFGKWEMGFQSFCSIEKPIGHRVVFFLWQFKGLRNWKTEMKNWALNMLEWKTRNSFRIASQNDAHECFLISSQTYLLCLALVLDINLEERNRPIWIWFLQGYLGWEVHPPRHQREGFFGFVSLPLPSLKRDNSHNLHDHKRSLVRTRWTMLAVTSP